MSVRQIVFVCASAADGELNVKMIPASSPSEATELFFKQFGHNPTEVLGPFYKKRTQVIEETRVLIFTNQTKKAVYNDWVVNAFILKEPENQAYLVFIRKVDGKKAPLPKGTITAPISDLRFI